MHIKGTNNYLFTNTQVVKGVIAMKGNIGIHLLLVLLTFTTMLSGCIKSSISENTSAANEPISSEEYYNSLIDAYISANKTIPNSTIASDNASFFVCTSGTYYELNIFFPNGAPIVNQQSVLRAVILAKINYKNVSLEINLPKGIELVSGDPKWTGDMANNSTNEINIIIRPIKSGDYEITTVLTVGPQPSYSLLGIDHIQHIYLITTETKALWDSNPYWRPKPSPHAGIIEIRPGQDNGTRLTEQELQIMDEKGREANKNHVPPGISKNGTIIWNP